MILQILQRKKIKDENEKLSYFKSAVVYEKNTNELHSVIDKRNKLAYYILFEFHVFFFLF